MEPNAKPSPTAQYLNQLKVFLQDPVKLKLTVIYGICFVGFILIGIPLFMHLQTLEQSLDRELKRKDLILAIQNIKSRQGVYSKRMNKTGSINWWVQYVLDACRRYNLKVSEYRPYEPGTPDSKSGVYKGFFLRMTLLGEYGQYLSFINWVESNPWGMRVARIGMRVRENSSTIETILIIGIMAAPDNATAAEGAKEKAN